MQDYAEMKLNYSFQRVLALKLASYYNVVLEISGLGKYFLLYTLHLYSSCLYSFFFSTENVKSEDTFLNY